MKINPEEEWESLQDERRDYEDIEESSQLQTMEPLGLLGLLGHQKVSMESLM